MDIGKVIGLEDFFSKRSIEKIHSSIYLAIELSELPTKGEWIYALNKTMSQYFKLRCNVEWDLEADDIHMKLITAENGTPIKYEDVIEYVPWKKLEQDEIQQIFQNYHFHYDSEHVAWKILVLKECNTCVLLLTHALYDGMSLVKIWQSILQNLGNGSMDNTEIIYDAIDKPDKQFTSQHPYELIPTPWSWKAKKLLVSQLFKYAPSTIVKPNKNIIQFPAYNFKEGLFAKSNPSQFERYLKNDFCLHRTHINNENLTKTLKICKVHGVSFTSYLAAVLVIAMRKMDPSAISGNNLQISIPINSRKFCQKSLNLQDSQCEVGNFISGSTLSYLIDTNEDIWIVAGSLQDDMVRNTTSLMGNTVQEAKLLESISCADFLTAKISEDYPGQTLEITNLGFQNFNIEGSKYHVKSADFATPQGISNVAIYSVISTPNDGLRCNFSYPKNYKVPWKTI
ncbi:hypothetical protein TBLA_0D02390 [Henningerozyma blattae CBS 6284]|uniref:Condensation domain-containing protein n=1 Tax=Henningerozyma blattae (strain ATCC 34711 / CBS 6284 / DSM 70876 / NBRC 10599 / NRRL Y-10934 / UCD 77-7) TaxID=1071380 RepID=I2H2Z1_HENB6|nr:hypothetical protein TBLA_0D02390 [Tetrapisispora blattae CBS 6284]CCH60743.1 hypothetical protein TBLA_0D02390 [Tetrapisispora blattae CBS 6284]